MALFDLQALSQDLPVLNTDQFQDLQQRIQKKQQIIKEGRRPKTLGIGLLWGQVSEPISLADRFKTLQDLICDYRGVTQVLKLHRDAYLQFFQSMKQAVRSVVSEKCTTLIEAEQERQEVYQWAQKTQKHSVINQLRQQEVQLARSLKLLGQGTFLLIKKIELLESSLHKLSTDQMLQETLLHDLLQDLEHYQRLYKLQQKIDALEQDIAAMANFALNFESILADYLLPFQGLIDRIIQFDQALASSVQEIQQVTQSILTDATGACYFSTFDDTLLNFLIRSHETRDQLADILSQVQINSSAEQSDLERILFHQKSLPAEVSVDQGVSNILTFVDLKLGLSVETSSEPDLSSVQKESNLSTIAVPSRPIYPRRRFQLISSSGTNYAYLQNLLKANLWREADQETAELMLKATNRDPQDYWSVEDFKRFPADDLQAMNQLWAHYSRGRFGFGVQKKLYIHAGNILGGEYQKDTYDAFAHQVGWKVKGRWISYPEGVIFDLSAPVGHLPLMTGMWGTWVAIKAQFLGLLFARKEI